MIRLGLQLVLASGREALTRLLVIAAAVAVGVALLLGVLAEFHAFQADSNRPCWECTNTAALPDASPLSRPGGELQRGLLPGTEHRAARRGPPRTECAGAAGHLPASSAGRVLRLAGAGARCSRTVPADQLGDRFPGTLAGVIGNAALDGPDELAIFIGYTPRALEQLPGSRWVTSISTSPGPEVFTPFFRYAFATGVLAILFPVLILIEHRHPAGRGPPRGTLRRVAAGGRDAG